MDKRPFQVIALTPAGVADARLVLAADRAGCLGILNAEIGAVPYAALETLSGRTRAPYGLKITAIDDAALSEDRKLCAERASAGSSLMLR